MLAQILLEMYEVISSNPIAVWILVNLPNSGLSRFFVCSHNTHHYIGFFRKIRDTIREGTFEEFRQKFVESRREHAAPAPDAAVALCA